MRKVRRLLKTWAKVVDSRSNRVSRVESKVLKTLHMYNQLYTKTIQVWWVLQESRIEMQQSRIKSRFSRGSRSKCQLTFEWYCTVITHNDCHLFYSPPSTHVVSIYLERTKHFRFKYKYKNDYNYTTFWNNCNFTPVTCQKLNTPCCCLY